ncbi:hypothetical protein Mcup_1120 [Metallosphaera cuprina Ar-4]|uniref:Uncharacterized protein n=1 Tax=Metallosphaera cuprina (strain Ar-4) TaxID=1006006 RepID=F4G327_METCR|nr:hypothetical protein Mcup_1120 [Metallosphaera cuprina Ar-4]
MKDSTLLLTLTVSPKNSFNSMKDSTAYELRDEMAAKEFFQLHEGFYTQ